MAKGGEARERACSGVGVFRHLKRRKRKWLPGGVSWARLRLARGVLREVEEVFAPEDATACDQAVGFTHPFLDEQALSRSVEGSIWVTTWSIWPSSAN